MNPCGHDPELGGGSQDSCGACDRRELPRQAIIERETPTFTATTVPPALLKEHHTTVWAQLIVESGGVVFTEQTGWTADASPANPVVIVPHRVHSIAPSPDARFSVRFYRLPPT